MLIDNTVRPIDLGIIITVLLAVIGSHVRTTSRLTRMETKVQLIYTWFAKHVLHMSAPSDNVDGD